MKNSIDPMDLLAAMLRVKGITGDEADIIDFTFDLMTDIGIDAIKSPLGVLATFRGKQAGPRLLLATHLDTVDAGVGWSVDPFGAVRKGNMLYGRGAVDARGQAAAMISAFAKVEQKGLARGELVLALSIGEEGNHPSLPLLLEELGGFDAAIVGEPTSMKIATSQRGLIVARLIAEGSQCHAARSDGNNSIFNLAEDLNTIKSLSFERTHKKLGSIAVTPTRLFAGIADNATAPEASALLDIRTTPAYSHGEIIDILSGKLKNRVDVVSDKWIPCETPKQHSILKAAQKMLGNEETFASDAASDWSFLAAKNIAAIKIGPGDSSRSHRPDEYIKKDELKKGMACYTGIIQNYFMNQKY